MLTSRKVIYYRRSEKYILLEAGTRITYQTLFVVVDLSPCKLNSECIASALRNSIINLGMIPKVVYQDNGKAFKSRFFQNTDFEEDLFNGVYANLNIHSVFARPYNARAKVIERFFKEFQEEFKKGMPSYIGTCIEDKPAWLKRGEKLHEEWHKKLTNNHIPTVQETIKYINGWIKFHNQNLCPNDRSKTIQEMLDSVQKQNINPQVLDDLMMKTECRTINRHGITFLNMHYRSEAIIGIRDKVNIRYSLFDLSKIHVYSTKGEFLCIAHRGQKVHPMARVLGTVKDMEEYKYQYQKQENKILKLCKRFKNCTLNNITQLMDIEPNVLEVILLFLINENKIQEKDGIYSVIEELPTKNGIEFKNLKLMFMYHSPETVDLIMRSFCAELPTIKVSYLTGVGDSCICDFYKIFRNLIYERQLNELVNHYCKNPQKFRFRKFFEKYAYFYNYNNKIFVTKKPLQAKRENNFTQEEEQEFKKIYCYLARIESHNQNEVYLYQRLAESIWRREKSFEELYSDLKNNLIS